MRDLAMISNAAGLLRFPIPKDIGLLIHLQMFQLCILNRSSSLLPKSVETVNLVNGYMYYHCPRSRGS